MHQAPSKRAERPGELTQQALGAFERDLPSLFKEHAGQWVAYQGDQPIGFASQKHQLYLECLRQGWRRDEFVVFCIEPQETEMTLGPVILD